MRVKERQEGKEVKTLTEIVPIEGHQAQGRERNSKKSTVSSTTNKMGKRYCYIAVRTSREIVMHKNSLVGNAIMSMSTSHKIKSRKNKHNLIEKGEVQTSNLNRQTRHTLLIHGRHLVDVYCNL